MVNQLVQIRGKDADQAAIYMKEDLRKAIIMEKRRNIDTTSKSPTVLLKVAMLNNLEKTHLLIIYRRQTISEKGKEGIVKMLEAVLAHHLLSIVNNEITSTLHQNM